MDTSTHPRTLDDVEPADGADRAVDHLRAWLTARPLEVVGISVVLAGAVLTTMVVLWSTAQRPTELPPAATIGAQVDPQDGDTGASYAPDAPDVDAHAGHGLDQGAPVARASDGVTVHVSGGVHRAGVVTLPAGSRVADAVIAAGGATDDADLDMLNLARLLTDAEQVHVPRLGEEPPAHVTGAPSGTTAADDRIDVNHASAAELESLPGIGPSRAQAIIAYREEHGPFGVPGDLRGVSGIGETIFQNLADRVRVG